MPTRTALFSRKQSGGVFTVDDLSEHGGDIWFVDSGHAQASDSAGYGQNPDAPTATIDYAIGLATASNGDVMAGARIMGYSEKVRWTVSTGLGYAGGSGGSGLAAYMARSAARSNDGTPELCSRRIPSKRPLREIVKRTRARGDPVTGGLYHRDSMRASMRST